MTYNDIVDPYLKRMGMKRDKESRSVEIIFPHIIMDAQAQMYDTVIRPIPFKMNAKRYKKRWRESYNSFNTVFFDAYKDKNEVSDAIIEFMDSFSSFIEHDVFIAKIAIMNACMDSGMSNEKQEIIATCYLCNALARAAQAAYGMIYRTGSNAESVNRDIDSVVWCARELGKSLGTTYINTTEARERQIGLAMDILIKKTVSWLFDEAPNVMQRLAQ